MSEPERSTAVSGDQLASLMKRHPPQPVGMVEFEEGATAIHSSVPDLRAAWSAIDRGARLPLSFTGRWGTGEGATVETGRLHAAVGAVADLINTTGHRAFVVTDAPLELETADTDGVFVTFGLSITHSLSRLLMVNVDQRERLHSLLANAPTADELASVMADLGLEVFTLKFAGDRLDNVDDLRQWWGGHQVELVEVLYDRPEVSW